MGKPEDIPQDVWLKAQIALDRDPGQREEAIARAILAAKAEEREVCAVIADRAGLWSIEESKLSLPTAPTRLIAADRAKVAFGIRDAIRKRGEPAQ